MPALRPLRSRPWPAVAAALVVAGIALLVVPVPYELTTGHEARVTFSGPSLDPTRVGDVARQFRSLLGVERVDVEATNDDGVERFTMTTSVPGTASPEAAVRAFVAGLTELGYQASGATTPRRERVSGTVLAYARDRVIRISVDGKSAAELEAEIRARLAEAGIPDAAVSVTDEGNARRIKVEADRRVVGDDAGSKTRAEELPDLVLTKDGASLTENAFRVRIAKRKSEAGATLLVEVGDGERTARVEVIGADAKSDAALAAEIETGLRQAGLDAIVAVTDGRVEVRRRTEKD